MNTKEKCPISEISKAVEKARQEQMEREKPLREPELIEDEKYMSLVLLET